MAYDRAINEANHWGTIDEIIELKLQSRKDWAPAFSILQKKLASRYVNSLLDRLYNLVTTGEERKSFGDRLLDIIY